MRETIEASEAAEILGVSTWTVYSLARRGVLPHIRIGRRTLFRRQSLLEWLAEQEAASMIQPDPGPGVRRLKA
jgi:excisionase family DNA binding protein